MYYYMLLLSRRVATGEGTKWLLAMLACGTPRAAGEPFIIIIIIIIIMFIITLITIITMITIISNMTVPTETSPIELPESEICCAA